MDHGLMPEYQMSGPWLNARIKDMVDSRNSELQKTGKLLKEHPSLVIRELWHYKLFDPKKSSFSVLDSNAKVRYKTTKDVPNAEFIAKSIRRTCKSEKRICEKW